MLLLAACNKASNKSVKASSVSLLLLCLRRKGGVWEQHKFLLQFKRLLQAVWGNTFDVWMWKHCEKTAPQWGSVSASQGSPVWNPLLLAKGRQVIAHVEGFLWWLHSIKCCSTQFEVAVLGRVLEAESGPVGVGGPSMVRPNSLRKPQFDQTTTQCRYFSFASMFYMQHLILAARLYHSNNNRSAMDANQLQIAASRSQAGWLCSCRAGWRAAQLLHFNPKLHGRSSSGCVPASSDLHQWSRSRWSSTQQSDNQVAQSFESGL